MNRTAALLLALTTLLAHCLLIHQDNAGRFAPPYDSAHASFRLARNLVYTGEPTWNIGREVVESSSPLWVAVCAVGERLYLPVTTFAQTIGILCALASVVLAAQFARDRLAGVIAPLLLVVNGSVAAAGASGTETPLITLLVCTAFLAQETRRPRALALALVLLWVAGGAGELAVVILLAFEVARRLRRGRPSLLPSFAPVAAVAGVVMLLRWRWTGTLVSPAAAALPHASAWRLGLDYLASFALVCGTPLLVVVPLAYLLRGKLVGRGRRALFFGLCWSAVVCWIGGDGLPYWNALVPALPLLFLAVQDGLTMAFDTRHRLVTGSLLALLAAGVGMSTLASKLPGKLGPLPSLPQPVNWIARSQRLEATYDRAPARKGLVEEINHTDRLRSVGVFLRDSLGSRAVILTPWPGAIGYLSRRVVLDMRGRVTLPPGRLHPNPWYDSPRVDLAAQLELLPDYVVAWVDPAEPLPKRDDLVRLWLEHYDEVGPGDARRAEVAALLEPYELVAVPVPAHSSRPESRSEFPVYLLRRADLKLAPRLRLHRDETSFRVTVRHRGHFQLADLELTATDEDDRVWSMRPTGRFELDADVRARKRLLLYPTGSRPVELLSGTLPPSLESAALRAVLRNPDSPDEAFSAASNDAVAR